MKTNVTTLVKSIFAQRQAEKGHISPQEVAVKHFGAASAVAQMMVSKGFTDPTQADYAAIAASQQFVNLVKEKSLIGQIEALGRNLFMPMKEALSSFDLSACEVVAQAQPTAILTEVSELEFKIDAKKIGGYAIFPERYFTSDVFSKVEPLINSALINSYVAGENADFIESITADATTVTATGSTMPTLLADITNALASIDDPQDAILLLNPFTALNIANELELDSLGVNGGFIRGIPVITNKSVPQTQKIIFDASKLILATDPTVQIALSNEATVNSLTDTPVYLFQENKMAIKVMGVNGYQFKTGHSATVIEG
ncbi:hypothetical protein [Acinetobacter sp. AL9]|uniref:hypothetical protein n=1 Tax=Acinetobacter sp. AL9 TaxID=3273234 RepID=UPI00355630DD